MRPGGGWGRLLLWAGAVVMAGGVAYAFGLVFSGSVRAAYVLAVVSSVVLGLILGRMVELRRDKRDSDDGHGP